LLLHLAACAPSGGAPVADEAVTATTPATQDATPPNPAQAAYAQANDRMHAGMGRIDPDADIAFVEGMIPHHQGAIDMAQIVLKHGKDSENQKLARAIIAAQEKEIAEMKAWLEKRGRPYREVAADSTDHSAMGH
jgi:uncharacterized protein (DUF305 family)